MKTENIYPQSPGQFILSERVPGGGMWSAVIGRHTTLRLTALQKGANVGMMVYSREDRLNRLNLPDTLKAQYTAKLTHGNVLMSDMGHVLFSITADTCGWHDPLGGHNNARLVAAKYGETSFQKERNEWYRNAHDNFLIELSKHGLGPRDLVANVNFFSRVDVDESGGLKFHSEHSEEQDYVDLRAELDLLVVLNTCQHPLDPNPNYEPRDIDLALFRSSPPTMDDFCRRFRPETERSFFLTEQWHARFGTC